MLTSLVISGWIICGVIGFILDCNHIKQCYPYYVKYVNNGRAWDTTTVVLSWLGPFFITMILIYAISKGQLSLVFKFKDYPEV